MEQPAITLKHFGNYLEILVKSRELSVSQLAEAAGLEPDFVVRLLNGEHILTGDVAFLLAEVLALSPLELLEAQRLALLDSREPQAKRQLAA